MGIKESKHLNKHNRIPLQGMQFYNVKPHFVKANTVFMKIFEEILPKH